MSNFSKELPAKQAIYCLEHLLYDISEKTLHNVAAGLAQETGKPVETFGTIEGRWTWSVVERFLQNRGMKCTVATQGQSWLLDSPTYLRQSPGFVGFIIRDSMESYIWKLNNWYTTHGIITQELAHNAWQNGNTIVVHKMWAPLESFYNTRKAFHITTDDSKWTRYECQPTSCWRAEPVCYDQRDQQVKKYMRAHKKSSIMMSNNQEIVLCTPGPKGWATETVLNYEFLDIEETSKRMSEIIADKLVVHIGEGKGWGVMSHALFSALTHLGGLLKPKDCSDFTPEDMAILQKYENGMYKSALEI